jgi:hypothetical protein
LLLATARPLATAEAPASSEYEVKAAFIYNFAKFVEWPPDDGAPVRPFVIVVLGKDPFGRSLDDMLRGKTIGGSAIDIRRVARIDDVGRCEILFISDSERTRLAPILKRIASEPILTVGESAGFASQGGIIGFRLQGERVRLEVSVGAAERAGLRISSQLLRVARLVGPGPGSGS